MLQFPLPWTPMVYIQRCVNTEIVYAAGQFVNLLSTVNTGKNDCKK